MKLLFWYCRLSWLQGCDKKRKYGSSKGKKKKERKEKEHPAEGRALNIQCQNDEMLKEGLADKETSLTETRMRRWRFERT